MRTSAAGNRRRAAGFTLLELLVVVAIIAIATAGVQLALRDSSVSRLEREAERLAALLESARAQSRAIGAPVRWLPVAGGFAFDGLPPDTLPQNWLDPDTVVDNPAPVLLGPEPLLPPQGLTLRLRDAPSQALRVSCDGLRPFRVTGLDNTP